ncbi:MAG: hypothetical protein L6Q83_11345 [Gammaproteobacteria bacterium]|nr:hypothetical protein [Gammaproteobacteria bacterium]
MTKRSTVMAVTLAALLGFASAAQADRGRGPPHWSASPRHHVHDDRAWKHHRQHDRLRYRAYQRGYRHGYGHGYGSHGRHGYRPARPPYYGGSGYGFNVWLDGVGVNYWESCRYCD